MLMATRPSRLAERMLRVAGETRLIAFLSDVSGQSHEIAREEARYIPHHSFSALTAPAAVRHSFCGICKDWIKTV